MTVPTLPETKTGKPDTPLPDGQKVHRPQRVSLCARVVRGAIAGGFSASLAAASHFAADMAPPEPVLVVAAVVVAVGVCVLLAGHRMGPVRLGLAVALSQGAYHLVFSLFDGDTAGPGPRSPQGIEPAPGHIHPPPGTVSPDLSLAETVHWLMLLLHLVAALVTYVVLRHGERAWWSLVDVLGTPIRRLLAGVTPQVTARRPLVRPGRFFERDLHYLGCALEVVTPRGPPVAVL